MERVALFGGIWVLLTYLISVTSLVEWKRALKNEVDNCDALMRATQRKISHTQVPRSKKRKRDDDVSDWMGKGKELIDAAQRMLGQGGGWRNFVMGAKMRWDVCNLVYKIKVHQLKGDVLLRQALYDSRGPCCGNWLPVNKVVGQVASTTLNQLKLLLDGDEIGRIAICGITGIGKTFLMKHLHNLARNRFDYVFWVPSPVQFTNKSLQDAVAARVSCSFSSDDSLSIRARRLSNTLSKLGSFAIFLDGVPKPKFSLEQVGIPVPANGSNCKLVLTTSSVLEPRSLDCFKTIEIQRLPKEDACELFMHKANVGNESFSLLDGIPSKLVESCCGVPRVIDNIATRLYGINDPCEWRNALFENKRPRLEDSCPFLLCESEASSSTHMRLG